MKKFLFKVISITIPLLVLVVGFNFLSDSSHLFSTSSTEGKIAEMLVSGKNIANYPSDLNYRKLQLEYVQKLKQPKKIVVLGSSRNWQINSTILNEKSFFNSCVASANLTDFIALYDLYKENKLLPQFLILGVDPWMIDDSRGKSHNKTLMDITLASYYSDGLEQINIQEYLFFSPEKILNQLVKADYIQLFSLKYFQSSLRNYFINRKKITSVNYYPISDQNDDHYIYLADGSIIYSKTVRQLSVDSTRYFAKSFAKDVLRTRFSILQSNINTLDLFFKQVQKDQVVPIIVLMPYHPLAYSTISEKTNTLIEVEKEIRKIAAQRKIQVIGSYDPTKYNFTESDFYDHYHPKPIVVEKLLKNLF